MLGSYFSESTGTGTRAFYGASACVVAIYTAVGLLAPLITPPNPSYKPYPVQTLPRTKRGGHASRTPNNERPHQHPCTLLFHGLPGVRHLVLIHALSARHHHLLQLLSRCDQVAACARAPHVLARSHDPLG